MGVEAAARWGRREGVATRKNRNNQARPSLKLELARAGPVRTSIIRLTLTVSKLLTWIKSDRASSGSVKTTGGVNLRVNRWKSATDLRTSITAVWRDAEDRLLKRDLQGIRP
jgi:hypothetical protein